jgi:oligopeptidase B
MRKENGFQPMELESSGSLTEGESGRRRHRANEFPTWFIWTILNLSVLLVVVVVVLFTSEENTLWGAGLLPGNNKDEQTSNNIRNPAKNNNNDPDGSTFQPPLARRESDRVVQVGIPPLNWDPTLPRQSEESTVPLLDPPQLVPDPYGWLRDDERSDPEILSHLHAENNYTQRRLQHLTPLQETLYEELLQYMEETSHSFPTLDRSFYYYRRTLQGQPYPLHCRAPKPSSKADDASFDSGKYLQQHLEAWDGQKDTPVLPDEVVYMDENAWAGSYEFFSTKPWAISPSEDLLAYGVDTTGSELYQLRIIRIGTGEVVFDGGEDLFMAGELAWGLDDDTLFYTKPDDTQRSYQVWRRSLSSATEELLYDEPDVTYWVGFGMTMDKQYLLIETASTESSEFYYMNLEDEDSSTLNCISKRRPQVLYSVEHFRGQWWILSNVNDADGDMQLFRMPVGGEEDDTSWSRVTDPKLQGVAMEDLSVFRHHIVIEGRASGILGLWILEMDDENPISFTKVERVEFLEEPAHTVDLAWDEEYDINAIIVNYVSMVTPLQRIQVNLYSPNGNDRLVVYATPTPGYQKNLYGCQRIDVLSRDGKTLIPVSLVYRASTWNTKEENGGGAGLPIHLYAYGAYGDSMDDSFSSTRLPLLDRGMIFAVAHVRGGGEMGREWYTDGKLFNKHKTFDDFVDVGRYFVKEQWTTPKLLSCEGRSAGGLTMGASLNQAPDLFRAAILGVPFVDLIVTMMDASIPLTTSEWREWGNPNEQVRMCSLKYVFA